MKGIKKIRLTGKDINVIHLIMREYQPTITVSDVIFGLQVMGMRQNHTAMLSIPEAARMLDTTNYKVRCALKESGLQPVSFKKMPWRPDAAV